MQTKHFFGIVHGVGEAESQLESHIVQTKQSQRTMKVEWKAWLMFFLIVLVPSGQASPDRKSAILQFLGQVSTPCIKVTPTGCMPKQSQNTCRCSETERLRGVELIVGEQTKNDVEIEVQDQVVRSTERGRGGSFKNKALHKGLVAWSAAGAMTSDKRL